MFLLGIYRLQNLETHQNLSHIIYMQIQITRCCKYASYTLSHISFKHTKPSPCK